MHLTFENPKPEWAKRKEAHLVHIADSRAGADTATCIVSVADKLHNARAILHDLRNVGIAVFDRFDGSQKQLGWYYGRLARVLHRRLAGEEALALAMALRRPSGKLDTSTAVPASVLGSNVEHTAGHARATPHMSHPQSFKARTNRLLQMMGVSRQKRVMDQDQKHKVAAPAATLADAVAGGSDRGTQKTLPRHYRRVNGGSAG